MRGAIEQLQQLLRGWAHYGADEEGDFISVARTLPPREIIRRFWPDARPYRHWLLPLLLLVALGPALDAAPAVQDQPEARGLPAPHGRVGFEAVSFRSEADPESVSVLRSRELVQVA